MLTEELGVPGHHLRMLADFRTADRQGIAERGAVVGANDYDRWLSCLTAWTSPNGFRVDGFRHWDGFGGI